MRGVNIQQFSIEDWLGKLSSEEVALPEFQRDFVWTRHSVCKFIRAILCNQPVGCLLILPINEDESERLLQRPFESISTNPNTPYKHLLLDGQQRLTALWRAVNDEADPSYRYFLKFDPDCKLSIDTLEVESFSKSYHWVNDPKICLNYKKLIPTSLLWADKHVDNDNRIRDWLGSIEGDRLDHFLWIRDRSEDLRNYRLPALEMSSDTKKLEAINTFIEINSSSQRLKKFDIIVGEFLSRQKGHLREIRENAMDNIEAIEDYFDSSMVGDLLLKISCLCVGLIPTENNYSKREVLEFLAEHHKQITEGIKWTIQLVRTDKIFDKKRLPSAIPFRVLPALYLETQVNGIEDTYFHTVARAYLWRAFTTERYAYIANKSLSEDYFKLKDVVSGPRKHCRTVPIWDTNKYPLPTKERLIEQTWPTAGILSKAILAVSLRTGAKDINSNFEVTKENITTREYHHIFPKKYLENDIWDKEANKALNCILIGSKTNRKIAANPPMEYFKKLCLMNSTGIQVTDGDIISRLNSHAVPVSMLQISADSKISEIYYNFLNERALLIRSHIEKLANGHEPES